MPIGRPFDTAPSPLSPAFPRALSAQVYDYPNLRAWLTLGNMLCPKTNMPMFDVQVGGPNATPRSERKGKCGQERSDEGVEQHRIHPACRNDTACRLFCRVCAADFAALPVRACARWCA